MNIGCGTDIIEINRIQEDIENIGEKFINRVFTDKEIEYCESKKDQKYQHYAGRFAAKEAAFKAISIKLGDKYSVSWKDFEIINDSQGKPEMFLNNNSINVDVKNIDVSISHCKSYATANVVVLYND